MKQRINFLLENKKSKFIFIVFLLYFIWRIVLFFVPNSNEINLSLTNISWWGNSYQIIAFIGGFFGILIAEHWGGLKSILGRAIFFISLGLLLQAFGQTVAIYYVYFNPSALYPSVADVGFFGSVLVYIYGIFLLARATGVKVSLKSFSSKVQVVVIPLILLTASYLVFLRGYQFNWSHPLTIFLDFGYPFGQAIYVSLAILTLTLSRKFLGGVMKLPIIFLLCAFLFQYASDYAFLYTSTKGGYVPGGFVDVMYMISYFIMSITLLQLGSVFENIKNN